MQKVLTKSNLNETLPRLRSCQYEKQRPKKCRFLLGHCYTKKILTTNNLCKRNQPRDPICKLCKVSLETPLQLCTYRLSAHCRGVVIIQNWSNLSQLQNISRNRSLYKHSSKCGAHLDKSHRTSFHPLMLSSFMPSGLFGENAIEEPTNNATETNRWFDSKKFSTKKMIPNSLIARHNLHRQHCLRLI